MADLILMNRFEELVRQQRTACAQAVADLAPANPAQRELLDGVRRDLLDGESLLLTVPLTGPAAADLIAELDAGIITAIPLLTRMACVQYVQALADRSPEAMRAIFGRITHAVRGAALVEGGHARSLFA